MFGRPPPSLLLPVAACVSLAVAQGTVSIQPADTAPATLPYIDPSFAGFGIEPTNLFSFTGHRRPNDLSFNLIDNLVNYTRAPPHIRLGGNTQDYAWYQEDHDIWDWTENPNPNAQGNPGTASDLMIIGPRYFDVLNRFPYGTPITFGLNLAYNGPDYIDRIVTVAREAATKLTNLKLVSFEIGNEPDLYLGNGMRTGAYDATIYAQEWLERAAAVYTQVLQPLGIPPNFFEPAATASTIGTTFQLLQMYQESGINQTVPGTDMSYIAQWNQHDYFHFLGISVKPLTLAEFGQFSLTDDQFAHWKQEVEDARQTPYRFALREMQSVGPVGLEGITNTFTSALWTLNFFLYAASLNITSVQMHMTDNSNASSWQPVERYGRQPFVRPVYYGYAAFDQVIGPTCRAQITELPITSALTIYDGYLKAYAVYQAGQLATIVVINGQQANVSTSPKPSITVQVDLPASLADSELHLAYLNGPGSDAIDQTIWNGISYETSGDGTPTSATDPEVANGDTVTVASNGTAFITVRDSQAVVANLGQPVGQRAYDEAACNSLATLAAPNAVEPSNPDPSDATGSNRAEGDPDSMGTKTSQASFALCLGVLATILMGVF